MHLHCIVSFQAYEAGPKGPQAGATGQLTLYTSFPSRYSLPFKAAPVAQLDRAPDFESVGRRFESCRARQPFRELLSVALPVPSRRKPGSGGSKGELSQESREDPALARRPGLQE